MGLDLSALSRQVRAMSGSLAGEASDKQERQSLALGRYLEEADEHAAWAQAADLSRETAAWLLARPVEPLNAIYDLPARPRDYALIATDGSQIDVERHGMAACYVINVGRVYLRYGARPAARLSARPTLYYRDEDLYLSDGVRRIPIEGNYLSAKRDIEEGLALAELADEFLSADSADSRGYRQATSGPTRENPRESTNADEFRSADDADLRGYEQLTFGVRHPIRENPRESADSIDPREGKQTRPDRPEPIRVNPRASADSTDPREDKQTRPDRPEPIRVNPRESADQIPAIALQDGTLVRWTLAGAEKFVQEQFLRPYLAYLDQMRTRAIPVASYISRPRAPEVAGTIRLMLCPDVDVAAGRGANCSECSDAAAGRTPSCYACQGLTDADILADMLSDGQRGPLFVSMSRINVEAYGPHLIHFFYMRVGREVARVELPRWVAEDRAAVDLLHTLIYDQCMKGQGYPVALARAHEQAIVRAADRRAFLSIVEGSLLRAELPASDSRKRESKDRQAL
ncbi:MAG: DNA double-strand break repair nuclease NurA [Kouleothrix sp.]|nr:DNA double-strand break repair nuclease NurA [Kouleothrix sp.]